MWPPISGLLPVKRPLENFTLTLKFPFFWETLDLTTFGSYHMTHMEHLSLSRDLENREKNPLGQKGQKHSAAVKIEFDHILRSPV